MNKQNKKMQSLIFNFTVTLVLLVVTLFAFLSVHYGWFASNTVVTATGMNISIDRDDTEAYYYVYKYDTVREIGSKSSKIYEEEEGHGSNDVVLNSIANMSLSSYDMIFKDRNARTYVVFRVELTGTKLEREGTITLILKRNVHSDTDTNTLVNEENNKKFAYISSCVSFKSAAKSSLKTYLQTNPENEDGLWKAAKTEFNSVSTTKSFMTINSEGSDYLYHKEDTLEFVIPYTDEDWDGNKLYVYLFMDYNIDFITAVYDEYMSGSGSSSSSGDLSEISLALSNDFVQINAKHSTGGNNND